MKTRQPTLFGDFCTRHGVRKDGISRGKRLADGTHKRYLICLLCRRESKRKYEQRFPDRAKQSRRSTKLKRIYGISQADYEMLLALQGGACAVCSTPPTRRPLSVDHKGRTVRGLLCDSCNFAAGSLKDSPELATRLAAYLHGFGFTRIVNSQFQMPGPGQGWRCFQ